MSSSSDINIIVRSYYRDGTLTDYQATELLMSLYGALEWKLLDGVKYSDPNYDALELIEAKRILGIKDE